MDDLRCRPRESCHGVRVVEQKEGLYRSLARCLKTCGPGKWDSIKTSTWDSAAAKRAAGKRPSSSRFAGLVASWRAREGARRTGANAKGGLLASEVGRIRIGLLKPSVRRSRIAAEMNTRCARAVLRRAFEKHRGVRRARCLPHARPTANA